MSIYGDDILVVGPQRRVHFPPSAVGEEVWTPLDAESVQRMIWAPWEATPSNAPASAQSLAQNAGAADSDPLERIVDWTGNSTPEQTTTSQQARLFRGSNGINGDDALYFDGDDVYSLEDVTLGYLTYWLVAADLANSIVVEHNVADLDNRHYLLISSGDFRVLRGGFDARANSGGVGAIATTTGAIFRGRFASSVITKHSGSTLLQSAAHGLGGTGVTGRTDLGGRLGSGFYVSGLIQGYILADDPTTDEIEQIETWLSEQTGFATVTVPSP